jgi:glycosyltransferase involved in cell wall biosynthesis
MIFFSVILPVYNRVHTVERAINCVLGQTYQNFELIVVDDGSEDGTDKLLANYSTNEKVKYIYQENKGVCSARNTGALKAKGVFLVFLDSDDTVEKYWLEDFHKLDDGAKNIFFCNMRLVRVNGEEDLYYSSDPYRNGKSEGIFIPGAWAIHKNVFFEAGMFDEKIKFGENVELSYRLEMVGLKKAIVDKFNFNYFESLDGASKNLQNKIDSNIYILNKHFDFFKNKPGLFLVYYQTTGVALARTGQFVKARNFFWKAFRVNYGFKNFIRYSVTFFPNIAKKQWKIV